jgi:CelD/BcsL family acetyltransferase involved in cellulose biosynthesis
LHVQIVTDAAALHALEREWSALLSRSANPEPMLSPAWLLTWWSVYGRDRQLCVGLFYDGDRLVGLAPFQRRRFWYRPCIPFQRLEPLGADVDEGDGVCSDYLNVIAEAGYEDRVVEHLVRALRAKAFGKWTELVLPAMNGEDPMVPRLSQALTRFGLTATCQPTGSAPFIALPGTWEEYLQALHGKKRYVITRALRDFDKWAGTSWELHETRSATELAEGQRVLHALHNERWQEDGGVFQSDRFRAFHDAVMPRLLADGQLELLWLAVRGEPIAALYNIVANNKVYFYQAGRKMDLPKGQRPGLVILAKAIQRAIAAGRREFDFLAGPSQYKSQFAPMVRPLVQIRAVPFSFAESVRRLTQWGKTCFRSIKRRTSRLFSRNPAPDKAPSEASESPAE